MGKNRFLSGLVCFGLLLSAAPAVNAALITYDLASHPAGQVSPPPYGLRLDGLYGTGGSTEWTFDFDHPSSSMQATLDTNTNEFRIFGTVFGGVDAGTAYDPTLSGAWSVDFTYQTNGSIVLNNGTDLEYEVVPEAPLDNNGTLTPLFSASSGSVNIVSGVPVDLEQEKEFFFNNTDDHRLGGSGLSGPTTFVGWGWLNHSSIDHIVASDWLFTATVVPVPAAVWLFGSALGLLGFARNRRSRRT